jgi:hypothetical protein
MDTAVEILQFVIVVSAGIVAGGQLFCLLAVLPAMRYDWGNDPEFSAKVHQDALTERPHRYLRVASVIPLACAIAVLIIERSLEAAMVLTIAGIAFALVNAVLSSREWPINDEIVSWRDNPAPLREKYPELRRRWDEQHLTRTIGSLLSLACFAVAAIVY